MKVSEKREPEETIYAVAEMSVSRLLYEYRHIAETSSPSEI
jgi:hypothetical protein